MDHLTIPSGDFETVTPHDTNTLTDGRTAKALYVGTSGDVTVVNMRGATVTFVGMPAGMYPIRFTAIKATGTDADDLVAIF
jgi:hypothetical protein